MEALIGSYRLVDWVFTLDGITARRPFGSEAEGLLTYTTDGRMWAALMRPSRPATGTRSLLAASDAERAEAAAGYLSYAGTFEVSGDVIVHHVELSLFQDWVGTEQRRHFVLDGEALTLRTPGTITSAGKRAENTLRWRRIEGAGR